MGKVAMRIFDGEPELAEKEAKVRGLIDPRLVDDSWYAYHPFTHELRSLPLMGAWRKARRK